MSSPRMLSVSEAADMLGYSQRRIRQLLDRGAIPGALQIFPGSRWKVPEDAVRRLLVPRPVRRRAKAESSATPAAAAA